jgi:hypothetical protein
MKKGLLLPVLLALMLPAFSQNITYHERTKTEYLKKSKAQKTAGWILLGAGVGLFAGSVATYDVKYEPYLNIFPEQPLTTDDVDNTVSTFLGVGAAVATISGVICLISAMQNKKASTFVSISNERILVGQRNTMVLRTQPTLHLKIPL